MHASLEFLELELFVEEADLVEGVEGLLEFAGTVCDELIEGVIAIYESEEGVVHDEVIEKDLLLKFLLLGLFILLLEVRLVGVMPQFAEFLLVDELLLFDSRVLGKHVGVSAQLEALLYLPHDPLEFIIEIRNLLCNQQFEDGADLLQILVVLFEIKLEGTVRNSAVINCADSL